MGVLTAGIGYRVIAAGMPGMTTADTFQRKPQSFHASMSLDRLDGVLRAGRGVPAIVAQ